VSSDCQRRRRGAGEHVPNLGKIFFGQISCKIREFCYFFGQISLKKSGQFENFSAKYHVKFGHFVNFSYIIFWQKCLALPPFLPQVDWAPTPCGCRKIVSDGAEARCGGRLFHRLASETVKARLLAVMKWKDGTISWFESNDRSLKRDGMSLSILTSLNSLKNANKKLRYCSQTARRESLYSFWDTGRGNDNLGWNDLQMPPRSSKVAPIES